MTGSLISNRPKICKTNYLPKSNGTCAIRRGQQKIKFFCVTKTSVTYVQLRKWACNAPPPNEVERGSHPLDASQDTRTGSSKSMVEVASNADTIHVVGEHTSKTNISSLAPIPEGKITSGLRNGLTSTRCPLTCQRAFPDASRSFSSKLRLTAVACSMRSQFKRRNAILAQCRKTLPRNGVP